MQPAIKLEGDKLIITVDLSKHAIDSAPLSATGKSHMVCGTSGFVGVGIVHGHAVKLSLNVIRK